MVIPETKSTRRGTGPAILKRTRKGYRLHEIESRWTVEDMLRPERCTCPDDERHARGCPVHLAWTTEDARIPDVRGLSPTMAKIFRASASGTLRYWLGAKTTPFAPGRKRLAIAVGALREETLRSAPAHDPRGRCALETISRNLTLLQQARDVRTGRRILYVRRMPRGMLQEVRVPDWLFDLSEGQSVRVALPGDLDYPDPLATASADHPAPDPTSFESRERSSQTTDRDSSSSHEDLFCSFAGDLATCVDDVTSEDGWSRPRTFELIVWSIGLPYFEGLANECSGGGRGAAQWLRDQCVVWKRQGRTIEDVQRALLAIVGYWYKGRDAVRTGWRALISSAVSRRMTPNVGQYAETDEAIHDAGLALRGTLAVQGGADVEALRPAERDAVLRVLKWLNDEGRVRNRERELRDEARRMPVSVRRSEGRVF